MLTCGLDVEMDNNGREWTGRGRGRDGETNTRIVGEKSTKAARTSWCARGRAKQKPANNHSTRQVRSSCLRMECQPAAGIRSVNPITSGTKGLGQTYNARRRKSLHILQLAFSTGGPSLLYTQLDATEESNCQYMEHYLTLFINTHLNFQTQFRQQEKSLAYSKVRHFSLMIGRQTLRASTASGILYIFWLKSKDIWFQTDFQELLALNTLELTNEHTVHTKVM